MANKFVGTWKLKSMHQHEGVNMFLGDVDNITVNAYSLTFPFIFKIGGTNRTVTMTEGSSDSFSGSFNVGSPSVPYEVRAYKYSYQSKDFIVGLIGTPGLGPITPNDVISFTAVKTD